MSLFKSFTLTVKRVNPGYYDRGKWIDGSAVPDFQIQTSWQPANGHDREALEEGIRDEVIYKIYPEIELFTADPETQRTADIVVGPDGYEYEVVIAGNWQNNLINHRKCMVMRVKEGN